MGSTPQNKFTTDKLFYKIGEVSSIAEVEPHVLRYWESEFSFLKPRKNKTGQRVYSRKDVEQVLKIRDLLYKEKYTIAGVRNKFASRSQNKRTVSVQTIQGVKKKLKEMDRNADSATLFGMIGMCTLNPAAVSAGVATVVASIFAKHKINSFIESCGDWGVKFNINMSQVVHEHGPLQFISTGHNGVFDLESI